jgi:uncharacterized phage-associated protein
MLVDEEAGDSLSNLKLQKLVYYAQGCHLALFGKPLIEEPIEAWEHGPVVPALYRKFKMHAATPIPRPKNGIDKAKYTKKVRELLDEVFQVYGQFSASKLRNMTHAEPPWVDAYAIAPSTVISHASMMNYFKSQVNG